MRIFNFTDYYICKFFDLDEISLKSSDINYILMAFLSSEFFICKFNKIFTLKLKVKIYSTTFNSFSLQAFELIFE